MPEYTYVGDQGRTYYPPGQPAIAPRVGETVTFDDEAPADDRWVPAKRTRKSSSSDTHTADPALAGD